MAYSGFSDKLKTAALWAAQKTSGRMIQRQNHSAEKLFCQKLSEFYSDFECLMAFFRRHSVTSARFGGKALPHEHAY